MFVIGFEGIFQKCIHLGELCNDSRLYKNVYKVLTFENSSWKGMFERCFEKCQCKTICFIITIVSVLKSVYKAFWN